jgi:hypothetical protein
MSAETDPPRETGHPDPDPTSAAGAGGSHWDYDEPGADEEGSGSHAGVAPLVSPADPPVTQTGAGTDQHHLAPNMLPGRERRSSSFERVMVRVIATAGVVGIGVAIAAILASSHTQGWIIGLVVSIVSVVLSAVLWSSRQL